MTALRWSVVAEARRAIDAEDAENYELSPREGWTEAVAFSNDEFGGFLAVHESGAAALYWNDFVVNQWTEHFPSLAVGLLRLALLVESCAPDDEDMGKFFILHDKKFEAAAAGFFTANLE